jgi:hypothetical protein
MDTSSRVRTDSTRLPGRHLIRVGITRATSRLTVVEEAAGMVRRLRSRRIRLTDNRLRGASTRVTKSQA